MPIKLTNRFAPDTHLKEETVKRLKNKIFSKKGSILPKDSPEFPLLAIANYTILLGHVEKGEFKEWLDKKYTHGLSADVLYPETVLTEIILKALNMFPDPECLLERLINRLNLIKTKNRKIMR